MEGSSALERGGRERGEEQGVLLFGGAGKEEESEEGGREKKRRRDKRISRCREGLGPISSVYLVGIPDPDRVVKGRG
eukprot:758968-Hanusia_phi.AAC.5